MTISLLGPGKGNAMGSEFWEELPAVMDEINRMRMFVALFFGVVAIISAMASICRK